MLPLTLPQCRQRWQWYHITDPQCGSTTIAGGSVLDISTPDSSKLTFAGSNATLVLDQTATFSGTVAGFGAQNHIDLPSIAFGAPTTLGYTENSTNTGGTLTISDGSHAACAPIVPLSRPSLKTSQ